MSKLTAKDFWKQKFDEYPQNDPEKLAVVMMSEYAEYIQNKVSDVSAEEVFKKHFPNITSSLEYHFNEIIAAMEEYASIVNERKDSVRIIRQGEKICDCPECGAVIQHGLSDGTIQLIKNSSLFERKDSTGSWVKDSEIIKTVEFGDYISVEQKRYGCANEFYTHKVIGTLKSNVWMDIPAITHKGMSHHDTMEEIVACICEGVCEEKVIRYRIKDINSIKKKLGITTQKRKQMKTNPNKKANELIQEYEAIIEQHCNQSSRDSHHSAAVNCALKEVNQILKLSGLPQYQIIFWREVENNLENKI